MDHAGAGRSRIYVITLSRIIAVAALIWKSPAPLALRFSALILAAVLVNPHLYIYDLLALVPALLLLADVPLSIPQPANPALSHSCISHSVLPLFGPLSRWTHLQLSVPYSPSCSGQSTAVEEPEACHPERSRSSGAVKSLL